LELVSEGDIILILITKDDISGGGSMCSSGDGSSRKEHCFSFSLRRAGAIRVKGANVHE
jgi:hypothetical protein